MAVWGSALLKIVDIYYISYDISSGIHHNCIILVKENKYPLSINYSIFERPIPDLVNKNIPCATMDGVLFKTRSINLICVVTWIVL